MLLDHANVSKNIFKISGHFSNFISSSNLSHSELRQYSFDSFTSFCHSKSVVGPTLCVT